MASGKSSSMLLGILIGFGICIACLIAVLMFFGITNGPDSQVTTVTNTPAPTLSATSSDDERYEQAKASFNAGSTDTALSVWHDLAGSGHVKSQAVLGLLLLEGKSVRKDTAEAVRWLRHAADQGDLGSQAVLGAAYMEGKDVMQDFSEAARWLRGPSDHGNPTAQAAMGILYAEGHGVERDYSEAHRLFRLAADQGNGRGMLSLGIAYQDGLGVPRDLNRAAEWYRQADEAGEPEARVRLEALKRSGSDQTSSTSTVDEVEQCFQDAVRRSVESREYMHPGAIRSLCKQMTELSKLQAERELNANRDESENGQIACQGGTEPAVNPENYRAKPPRYPLQSRRLREQGSVTLSRLLKYSLTA